MTKPFYKRDWFVSLLVGVLLTTFGFILMANSILAERSTDWSQGYLFGVGFGFVVASGGFRNLENKIDELEKKVEATISLLSRQRTT